MSCFKKIAGLETRFLGGAAYPGGVMAVQSTKPGCTLMVGILMNRLVDKCTKVDEEGREAAVRLVISEYAGVLKSATTTKRVMAFLPFPRAGVKWTMDMIGMIHDTLRLVLLDSAVVIIPYMPVTADDFDPDGIHLNEIAQETQYEHFMAFFRQKQVDPKPLGRKRQQEEELVGTTKKLAVNDGSLGIASQLEQLDNIEVVPQPGSSRAPLSDTLLMDLSRPPPSIRTSFIPRQLPETLVEIRDRVVALEQDGLTIKSAVADLNIEQVSNCELIDTAINNGNGQVVIIDNLLKFGDTGKYEAKKIVEELCTLIEQDPGVVKAAYFLKLGKLPEMGRHFKIKAVFTTVEAAIGFRVEASKTRRESEIEPWTSCYISNDPTKSTRVRIEILKRIGAALAKQPSLVGFDFFVTRYDAKPVLVQKKGVKIVKRMGYMESIQKFGHMLREDDLKVAKKIAGKQFEGRFFLNFGI